MVTAFLLLKPEAYAQQQTLVKHFKKALYNKKSWRQALSAKVFGLLDTETEEKSRKLQKTKE